MIEAKPPTVRWLTATICTALLVFAATPTLLAICLPAIGADLGIGYGARGGVLLIRALVVAAGTFTFGCLADRLDKRHLLGGSLLLVALGALGVGQSSGLASLICAIVVMGVGLGGMEGMNSPLIAELYPAAVESHVNTIYAFYPCGAVISSLAAGAALDAGVRWRTLFLLLAAPAAAVAVMYWLGRYPAPRRHASGPLSVRRIVAVPAFWLLAVAMFLTAGVMGTVMYWIPTYLHDAYGSSDTVASRALAAFLIAMFVGRFGTGMTVRFVPLLRLLLGMGVAGTVALLGLALVRTVPLTMVMLVLGGLFTSSFWPAFLALAVRRVASRSATLLAMLSVFGIVGFGFLPWVAGQVADVWGLRMGLALSPLSMGVTVLLLLLLMAGDSHGPALRAECEH